MEKKGKGGGGHLGARLPEQRGGLYRGHIHRRRSSEGRRLEGEIDSIGEDKTGGGRMGKGEGGDRSWGGLYATDLGQIERTGVIESVFLMILARESRPIVGGKRGRLGTAPSEHYCLVEGAQEGNGIDLVLVLARRHFTCYRGISILKGGGEGVRGGKKIFPGRAGGVWGPRLVKGTGPRGGNRGLVSPSFFPPAGSPKGGKEKGGPPCGRGVLGPPKGLFGENFLPPFGGGKGALFPGCLERRGALCLVRRKNSLNKTLFFLLEVSGVIVSLVRVIFRLCCRQRACRICSGGPPPQANFGTQGTGRREIGVCYWFPDSATDKNSTNWDHHGFASSGN